MRHHEETRRGAETLRQTQAKPTFSNVMSGACYDHHCRGRKQFRKQIFKAIFISTFIIFFSKCAPIMVVERAFSFLKLRSKSKLISCCAVYFCVS